MNSSSLYKDFFRHPSAADKLNLFQLLYESNEIKTDLALALLKIIHRELGNDQPLNRSAYKQYARLIETLRYYKSDMLQQVVDAWNGDRAPQNPEWMSDGLIK